MIRIILSAILLLILPIQVWSETLTWYDLVLREHLYYKKFTNVPFTGEISGRKSGKIKNGKLIGEWLYFYKNGQLKALKNFKDLKKDGHYYHGPYETYYENGKLNVKGQLKDGEQDGIWEYFNDDGSLKRTETWNNGKKIGKVNY
mgnify:CR=1 FL=1